MYYIAYASALTWFYNIYLQFLNNVIIINKQWGSSPSDIGNLSRLSSLGHLVFFFSKISILVISLSNHVTYEHSPRKDMSETLQSCDLWAFPEEGYVRNTPIMWLVSVPRGRICQKRSNHVTYERSPRKDMSETLCVH